MSGTKLPVTFDPINESHQRVSTCVPGRYSLSPSLTNFQIECASPSNVVMKDNSQFGADSKSAPSPAWGEEKISAYL